MRMRSILVIKRIMLPPLKIISVPLQFFAMRRLEFMGGNVTLLTLYILCFIFSDYLLNGKAWCIYTRDTAMLLCLSLQMQTFGFLNLLNSAGKEGNLSLCCSWALQKWIHCCFYLFLWWTQLCGYLCRQAAKEQTSPNT